MSDSLLATTQRAISDRGLKTVALLALKKLVSPFARVGSLYFLERDLSEPMPPLKPIDDIVVREGSLVDIPLLDGMQDAVKHRKEALERLRRGDQWFIAVERSSGQLANYRWVSTTSGFIPELEYNLFVKPRHAYIYDLETLPEFRRRGIEAVSRQFTYDTLHRKYGIQRIVVYICADNHASLRAGRQYLSMIGRVWYVRLGDRVRVFMRRNDRMPELKAVTGAPAQAALLTPSSRFRK